MPHFDADQWSVLLITVIFGTARLIVAAFAVPLIGMGGSATDQLLRSIRSKSRARHISGVKEGARRHHSQRGLFWSPFPQLFKQVSNTFVIHERPRLGVAKHPYYDLGNL
jgi:hypothetical protein